VNVRRVDAADLDAALAVHCAAFGRDEEAEMAAAIVESGQFPPELSLAVVVDDRIAGHVISSWVGLEGSDRRLLQLGPIGVLPELHGQGIGSALVRASLDATRALGEPLLLLEGNPAYYGRFGFVRADELGLLPPPEALYDWAFQVAVLDEAAELPRGRVVYPPTFAH
jgi:predicted N-acetyltransferase YhbS